MFGLAQGIGVGTVGQQPQASAKFLVVNPTVADGTATYSWNMLKNYNVVIETENNNIVIAPTNIQNGDYGTIIINNNSADPEQFNWANWEFAGGAAPELTSGGKVHVISFVYDGTKFKASYGLEYGETA